MLCNACCVAAFLPLLLLQNAMINPSLGAIAERLQLKRFVPSAVERAIWDILNQVCVWGGRWGCSGRACWGLQLGIW
jgi:hypothetical protein